MHDAEISGTSVLGKKQSERGIAKQRPGRGIGALTHWASARVGGEAKSAGSLAGSGRPRAVREVGLTGLQPTQARSTATAGSAESTRAGATSQARKREVEGGVGGLR